VRRVLQRLGQHREVAIFVDEFDRLRHAESRMLFADTIKALSDRLVRATVFVIGVADSVADLIREHRSIERALVQIHMRRMSREEIAEIAKTGLAAARMTIRRGKPTKTPAFARHLDRLAAESRKLRYRFENPLLQPYVVMRGVSEGVVGAKDLQ
jgi:hypothetical protein